MTRIKYSSKPASAIMVLALGLLLVLWSIFYAAPADASRRKEKKGTQVPWVNLSMERPFYFVP